MRGGWGGGQSCEREDGVGGQSYERGDGVEVQSYKRGVIYVRVRLDRVVGVRH